jgi:hypothetical protein
MPGSAAAFAIALLPSCSGGLQSIRSDDLVSHWFDTTAAAFTYAGPRGRVIGVMHRLKDASSSHVLALTFGVFPGTFCISSFHHLVALALALRVPFQLSLSLLRLTPRGVLTIARLPGVSGPSGDRSDAATSANSTCVSLTQRQVFLPGSAASSSFLSSSTLHSASVSPTLSHVGVAPGLPSPSKVSPRP